MKYKKIIKYITVFIVFLFLSSVASTLVNPSNSNNIAIPDSSGTIIYNSNQTLIANVSATNIIIEPGVNITTNGYIMKASNNFDNYGNISAGYNPVYQNLTKSYGGSGGGAQSSYCLPNTYGFSTRITGGQVSTSNVISGSPGLTPGLPIINKSIVGEWLKNGIQNYISGAAGQNYTSATYTGSDPAYYPGGLGSYGVYIYANNLYAGNISAVGGKGMDTHGGGMSGGGGGGVIILQYGSSYTEGSYNVSGGEREQAIYPPYYPNLYSGSGGKGNIVAFKNTQTIYPQKYTVTFTESGLSKGSKWQVNLSNGESYNSTTDKIEFSEPNGNYIYTISDKIDYYAFPEHGVLNVDGSNVTMNVTFNNGTIFNVYSQYGSYFLSNVSFEDVIGVYTTLNGSQPVSVTGYDGDNSFTFIKESLYWNTTVNIGSLGSSNTIRIIATYSNGKTISKNFTIQIIPVPTWLSSIISSGLIKISKYTSKEWNNTYDISEIMKMDFSSMFSKNVTIPNFWAGNFSFIPSISLGLAFNSNGNITLFGSFTEKTPSIGIGPGKVSIGGTVKIEGDVEIDKNLSIQWVSAQLDMKIFGSASVNIPIFGDKFDIAGDNISLGISATISVNPSFALDLFFIPTSNSSMDIIPNINIAMQKIVSSISLPLTVQVNAGIGFASVSGGGTLTFSLNLQDIKPFDKGGDVTGKLFINYNALFWSGTIYSIGPSTLYAWGDVSGSSKDPSGNLAYMNRYFNVTGYDSFTWNNYSTNGTAIHDIYPQTTVSSVTYNNTTYVFYSSDNVSMPVNESLYIQGYKFDDSQRTMTALNMPSIPSGITLHPYAITLSNGSILLLWLFVPESELDAKSITDINNILLQGSYYNIETGKWSDVFNISSGSVAESYKASIYGGSVEVAVLSQHSMFSTDQNITVYSIPDMKEINNLHVTNVSEIETFSMQADSLGLSYINGSVVLTSISSNMAISPAEPGFVLVSNGYVSGNQNYEYLLFSSGSQVRILVINSTNDKVITNTTINISSIKSSVFYYHDSLFAAFASSGYVSIYNITEDKTNLFSREYEGSVYNFGVSSTTFSGLLWSLVNYGNETEPLLNLNFTELGNFYAFTVNETGLPSGAIWYVNLTNGMDSGPISGSSYTLMLSNGTYSYTIAISDRIYRPAQSSGSVAVYGKSISQSVVFSPVKYTITFKESGLPSGTSWSVNLNGTTLSSTTNTIIFSMPNGTYSYTVSSVSGYTLSPSSGSINIHGSNTSKSITFTHNPSKKSPFKLSTIDIYAIIGAVVAIAAIGGAVMIIRRRR